ncbi:MAG: protein jag [Spirochaetaceae bacterium]|jgi:spoIIIJ-associated protein|nr:protein jag [Spirochaetaceae bacterium]
MTYEFEGHTEKETIDRAIKELGLEQDCFDVEILESQKGGLFRKGYVKLKIHTGDDILPEKEAAPLKVKRDFKKDPPSGGGQKKSALPLEPQNDFEKSLIDFGKQILILMGHKNVAIKIIYRDENKLTLDIISSDSSILIGRKGRTLDALQLLISNYAAKNGDTPVRVILDCEDYRTRREEALVRIALRAAERVRRSKTSVLLEPMNPFDRRLIHTALSDMGDVSTKSEGDGGLKQVRVFYQK